MNVGLPTTGTLLVMVGLKSSTVILGAVVFGEALPLVSETL
jgi:hypothetical protein